MLKNFHSFHIVELSPWPILASNLIITSILTTIITLQTKRRTPLIICIIITIITSLIWWKNIIKENKTKGYHLMPVTLGIKIGIILFILSEVLFFTSFFWAFFHRRMRPNIEIGQKWPPITVNPFNPINIPLLNTIILLSSGASITWAHHSIIKNNQIKAKLRIEITIFIGIYFSMLQIIEYIQAEFTISDASYGCTFFIATGFHGIHVIIGSTFLTTILLGINKINNNKIQITGFELASWYWHFVDVVWILLYISIYWWGY
jgi:cytochrome c oxidase subunit 3